MEKIRIARFLAQCAVNSRRKCEALIEEGKVKVNGVVVKELFFKVDPEKDIVEYGGETLNIENKIALALNKPPGFLCTSKDDFNRKTVLDLVKDLKEAKRLFPVGRLDLNSRGLLIMTNDGDFAYKILHPKFNIPKTYEVILNKNLIGDDIERLGKGINIDGIKVDIKGLILSEKQENLNKITLTIHEGRKRIVRRIFKYLGYEVMGLKRIKIGNFYINGIAEGSYKLLNQTDIKKLLMLD